MDSIVLSRSEFADHWETVRQGLGDDDSVLWAYEHFREVKSNWFVNVPHTYKSTDELREYWAWCDKKLNGTIVCYSISVIDGEWWGFTDKDDVFWWLLRWM